MTFCLTFAAAEIGLGADAHLLGCLVEFLAASRTKRAVSLQLRDFFLLFAFCGRLGAEDLDEESSADPCVCPLYVLHFGGRGFRYCLRTETALASRSSTSQLMPSSAFKRSRALWDNARRPHETRSRQTAAYACAILYELQPIRFSNIDASEWRRNFDYVISMLVELIKATPVLCREAWAALRTIQPAKLGSGVSGLIVYYYFVRWAHEKLDAGPMILIVTALAAIFTFGLDDDPGNRHGLSAYSVFNRGFQRIMGSLDADALVAQHLGGGLAMAGGIMDDDSMPHERLEPAVRRPEPQAPAAPADAEEQPHENNRARRSGKKARRRNQDQRREIQRQRNAAMALGFADDGNDHDAIMRLDQ